MGHDAGPASERLLAVFDEIALAAFAGRRPTPWAIEAARRYAEASEAAPADLERIASIDDTVVRQAVAHNPSTPSPVLALLADDPDWTIRGQVALNSSTPAELLAALADDRDKHVRRLVAGHPQTPSHVLAQLADDRDPIVHDIISDR